MLVPSTTTTSVLFLECVRLRLAPLLLPAFFFFLTPLIVRVFGRETSKNGLVPCVCTSCFLSCVCTCGRVSRPPLSRSLRQKITSFVFSLYFPVDFIVRLVLGQVGFLCAGEAAVGSHEWSEIGGG